MGLMDGKRGLVLGVVNDYSIAWGISEQLFKEGAQLGFTHLPDKDPSNPKMARRVRKCVEQFNPKLFMPCDVQVDADIDAAFAAADRLIIRKHFPAFPLGLFMSHPALGVCVARHCGAHSEHGGDFQDQHLISHDMSSLL